MNIKNKIVLITGGAIRIGKALAVAFAEKDAKIIIHYNTSHDEALATLEAIGGEKKGHRTIQCDLSNIDCAEKIFSAAGKVDILINSASMFKARPLLAETAEDVEKQFRTNFFSPLELMKKFALQENITEACIINILDQRINSVCSNDASYGLSKKALADATLAAALQWAPGIRVNGIAPGPVLPPQGMEESRMEKVLKQVPSGKAVNIRDITDTCIFLAQNDSITGSIIYVDGGQHLN